MGAGQRFAVIDYVPWAGTRAATCRWAGMEILEFLFSGRAAQNSTV